MEKTSLTVGATANLLAGYDPSWLSSTEASQALFPPESKALEEIPVPLPEISGNWGYPDISLHDTAASLLDTLWPYQIKNPSDSFENATIPSGALLIKDEDSENAIKLLSATLGVDLGKTDSGYALVRIKRIDTTCCHPVHQKEMLTYPLPTQIPEEYKVTKEFKQAAARLKRLDIGKSDNVPEQITPEDANRYLQFFRQQGTHFVSKIVLGDVIFQIFQMPRAAYETVKNAYKDKPGKLSGPSAALFVQYTTNGLTGQYGYVEKYGNILSFSQSKMLRDSLSKGEWLDETFAETDSIFSLFQPDAAITYSLLHERYTEVTAVCTELTSLTLFMEYSRRLIWERIFKGGMIQKYQTAIRPRFHPYNPFDFGAGFDQNSFPGFLSTLATPYVNTYKPYFNLSELIVTAAEKVKQFTLSCNILDCQEEKIIQVPGEDILLNAQIVSLEKEYVPVVSLPEKGWDRFFLCTQHFFGGLIVRSTSKKAHYTIVDGLKYVMENPAGNARPFVKVTDDLRRPEGEIPVKDIGRVKNSLAYYYAFSEAMASTLGSSGKTLIPSSQTLAPSGKETFNLFLQKSFLWITQFIPSGTHDFDLLELRMRALTGARLGSGSPAGAFVPILPDIDYQDLTTKITEYVDEINKSMDACQRQVENRKTQELIIDVGKKLNENILDSGKLLHGYLQTLIEQQTDLQAWNENIIAQRQRELSCRQTAANDLWGKVSEQKSELATAIANYQQAIKDWQLTETVKTAIQFGLTVATDLFSLSSSLVIPASSLGAVKELGLLAQKIQKLLNMLNATNKLYNDVHLNVEKLSRAQKEFDGLSGLLSNDLPWDELTIHFDSLLAQGPSDKNVADKKSQLTAAFKMYVLTGKAYANANSAYNATARDIYIEQGKQKMIKDQTERLKKLHTELHPARIADLDVSQIDLIGMTGSLCAMQSQMLSLLAKTFVTRDQALQYAYLQDSTEIQDFSTLGLKSALVTQEKNKIEAKTKLSQRQVVTTTPIVIPFEVDVEELRAGKVYPFQIDPAFPSFNHYIHVKVRALTARAKGIKSTEEGNYFLKVTYAGQPFFDKRPDGEVKVFNTLERTRIYEYEVEGNQPRFTDEGKSWSDGVTPITPFSTWEISLPEKLNKGLKFEGPTVKITFTFILEVRILDSKRMLASDSTPPSTDTLLSQMASKTILNNWDIVFNMSLDKINQTLEKQYEELKYKDKDFGGRIHAEICTQGAMLGSIETYSLIAFDFKYGYPRLEFLLNSPDTAKLTMWINSGIYKNGNKYVGDVTEKNRQYLNVLAEMAHLPRESVKEKTVEGKPKLVLEYYTSPIELKENEACLEAVIKLDKVKGVTKESPNVFSVVLDMEKGAFSVKNIHITLSDEEKEKFKVAVKAYFANHPVVYIVNSLDISSISTLPDLKPHEFLFKVLKTQQGSEILQLFIQTNGRKAFNYSQTFISSDVPEPIPSGYDTSLMVHNRRFFENILPGSYKGNGTFTGVPATGSSLSYALHSMPLSVKVDLSELDYSEEVGYDYCDTHDHHFELDGGSTLSLTLDNLPIVYSSLGNMSVTYSKQLSFTIKETIDISYRGYHKGRRVNTYQTQLSLQVACLLPLAINGSERDQTVAVHLQTSDISLSGTTSGGGTCGGDSVQAIINKKLKQLLPPKIKDQFTIRFTDISIFVLKNLLFPTDNYINMQKAYAPGDFLLLGWFTK